MSGSRSDRISGTIRRRGFQKYKNRTTRSWCRRRRQESLSKCRTRLYPPSELRLLGWPCFLLLNFKLGVEIRFRRSVFGGEVAGHNSTLRLLLPLESPQLARY